MPIIPKVKHKNGARFLLIGKDENNMVLTPGCLTAEIDVKNSPVLVEADILVEVDNPVRTDRLAEADRPVVAQLDKPAPIGLLLLLLSLLELQKRASVTRRKPLSRR